VHVQDGQVQLGSKVLNVAANGAAPGPSNLFVRRHDMHIGNVGDGSFDGTVKRVRTFGPIQRADIALNGNGETMVEIDAPRDRGLSAGDVISLQPRRYRIFAA
jgi:sulfate transport system ATP-binding protein